MIYLDTSVALAHLLEAPAPPSSLWRQELMSSRLLAYELWTRIHSRGLSASHSVRAEEMLRLVSLLELAPPVLARALEPFPVAVRTLDALHLASIEFLRAQGRSVRLASYDKRMLEAATALGIDQLRL